MIVLRVERIDGSGPYAGGVCPVDQWNQSGKQPPPEHDGTMYLLLRRIPIQARRFGFRDRAQAYAWFSWREIEQLSVHGYALSTYAVHRIVYGLTQVCFDITEAVLLGRESLAPLQRVA